jgi:hypothetical protein
MSHMLTQSSFRLGRSTKSFGTMYVSVSLRYISQRTYHLPNPYGNSCAALNGISKPIVDRANELASLAVRGEDFIAACAELSEEEMQALQEAVRATSFFLCWFGN